VPQQQIAHGAADKESVQAVFFRQRADLIQPAVQLEG
jgi:hypothetical protein